MTLYVSKLTLVLLKEKTFSPTPGHNSEKRPNTNCVIMKTFPQALKLPGQGWDVCSCGQAPAVMAARFSDLSQQRTADARE